jgi:[ribosomal protein S18]-alanine N-acetyltransferase
MRKYSLRPSINLVLIRQATPDDVPAIRKLEQDAATAAHWSRKEYDVLFAPESPTRITLVAVGVTDSDCIDGFIIVRCMAEEWEIENVVVAPGSRRRGVATALVGDLLRKTVQSGAAAVLLEVRESNIAARQLYEKHGFREAGRRTAYYHDPLEDGLLLRISIAVP